MQKKQQKKPDVYKTLKNDHLLLLLRSMSLPQRHLETEKSTGKDKNRDRGSPVETSVFYDEREDSHTR